MIKIYRMNECDWVAAASKQEAIDWYKDNTGFDDDEMEEVHELTEAEMLAHQHYGDEDSQKKTPRSFKAELEFDIKRGQKFPCIFASTEY